MIEGDEYLGFTITSTDTITLMGPSTRVIIEDNDGKEVIHLPGKLTRNQKFSLHGIMKSQESE